MTKVVVRVREVPQPVVSNPEITVFYEGERTSVAAKSQLGWESPALMKALRQMFSIRENEVIATIIIDNQGIAAQFKRVE